VVVVADVALAHQQAGQVLQRIFAVGRVDRALICSPVMLSMVVGICVGSEVGRPLGGNRASVSVVAFLTCAVKVASNDASNEQAV
jgi:hypothetical protein